MKVLYRKLMQTQSMDKCILRAGLTLVEVLAAVIIASMITLAVLNVFSRAQATVVSVDARIDNQMVPNEIMQRIAEDLDRLTLPGLDTRVAIANKSDGVYNLTQMTIITQFYGSGTPPRAAVFERVVWQSAYDPVEEALMLYRSHTGINLEDKIVDQDLAKQQRVKGELFIPVKTGITFFEIVVPKGEQLLRSWRISDLPRMIRITLSMAAPQEDLITGAMVVAEEDKVMRTVAIDRTRMIAYKFEKMVFDTQENEPNSIFDENFDIGDTEGGEEPDDPDLPIDLPEPGPRDTTKE